MQRGLCKVLDTPFMIATMVSEQADTDHVEKHFNALQEPISTSGKNPIHSEIAANSRNVVVVGWTFADPEQANELRLNPAPASESMRGTRLRTGWEICHMNTLLMFPATHSRPSESWLCLGPSASA